MKKQELDNDVLELVSGGMSIDEELSDDGSTTADASVGSESGTITVVDSYAINIEKK